MTGKKRKDLIKNILKRFERNNLAKPDPFVSDHPVAYLTAEDFPKALKIIEEEFDRI
jgi:hypothetical protein